MEKSVETMDEAARKVLRDCIQANYNRLESVRILTKRAALHKQRVQASMAESGPRA